MFMDLTGKRVVVLGLGISGMEAAKLLQDHGAHVTVRDSAADNAKVNARAEELRLRGIEVELGAEIKRRRASISACSARASIPAVPLVQTLRQAGLPLFGELEMAYRFCECPIVAITGTNGKTTTTELVDALLLAGGKRTMASGNIGTAFSTAVRDSADLDVMVLEVSSFQLEHIVDSARASASISTSRPIISTATARWRNTRWPNGRSSATRPPTITPWSMSRCGCRARST